MKYFLCMLLMAGFLTAAERFKVAKCVPCDAFIDEGLRCELPHRPLPLRQGNAVLVDSSGNGYSAWTQIQECLAFNPKLEYLQFVNRGYSPTGDLYAHITPSDFSYWIHDYVYDGSLHGNARYPTSVASGNSVVSFPVLDPATGTWGHMVATVWVDFGLWFPVLLSGDIGARRNIGKQLPAGNVLFICLTNNDEIVYRTWSYDLSAELDSGLVGTGEYWGYDVNGGIAYIFYYNPATFNVYYRTTTDGINWSAETPWEITYPAPYANSVLDWTQMALTDAGKPILVFDIVDADDPGHPQRHKVYVQIDNGAIAIQVSDDFYQASWYPTIATNGDYVVVLMHVWTNGLEDSLARHDLFYNWSNDNGATWHAPVNITAFIQARPGLAQLAKRIDATNGKFFYFYGVDMVNGWDPFWPFWGLSE